MIPNEIRAGDSVEFIESQPDYLATDGWQLRLVLINSSNKVSILSSADGADHKFTANSTTTSTWVQGRYQSILIAEKAPLRTTLSQGQVEILPDPVASLSFDYRTQAQKTLDALRAAYDAMVAGGGSTVQQVSIDGRVTVFRSADDLLQQINYFQRMVNSEKVAKNLQDGCGFGAKILTRLA